MKPFEPNPTVSNTAAGSGCERGNAIVEFALILPLIIMLFIATVEFTRTFRAKEMMAQASRELAHVVYRECFDSNGALCNLSPANNQTDLCLSYYKDNFTRRIEQHLPGIELSVSMYSYDAASSTVEQVGLSRAMGSAAQSATRFSVPRISAEFRPEIEAQELLVIGEVFYTFQPLFGGVNTSMLSFMVPSFGMYDVTVF